MSLGTGKCTKLTPEVALFVLVGGKRSINCWPIDGPPVDVVKSPAGILLQGVPAGWLKSGFRGSGFMFASHWNGVFPLARPLNVLGLVIAIVPCGRGTPNGSLEKSPVRM